VLVIGAGISGLAAAKTLKEANIQFIVIESSGEIGGRIKSHQGPNYYVNLGAEFICLVNGPSGNARKIRELVHQVGLKTQEPSWES